MPHRKNIERLLRPRHVAFFGGTVIEGAIRYAEKLRYNGKIWVVNPRRKSILGHKCFRSVDQLPTAPDASFIAVAPATTVEIVERLSKRGAAAAVCYAAGFKEVGDRGSNLDEALRRAARGMAIVGPNAPGIINYFDRVAVTLDEKGLARPMRGVAVITQSGSFSDNASRNDRSLSIGYLLSTGNQSILESADYMDVLLDDDRVSAIGLHMEGLRDASKFHHTARRALQKGVPIVILKTGTSTRGAEAVKSHTASLATGDDTFDAFFHRLGIVRARTLPEFIETLKLLTIVDPLPGKQVAVLTCSGFDCSNAADIADRNGIQLPNPSVTQCMKLSTNLTDVTKPSNPLDCSMAMWGDQERQTACFEAMMSRPYDLALLIVTYPRKDYGHVRDWDAAVNALIAAKRTTRFPCICAANLPEGLPLGVRQRLIHEGIAPLQGLPEAMFAIRSSADYRARRGVLLNSPELARPPISGPRKSNCSYLLNEWQSKSWVKDAGVQTPNGKKVLANEVTRTCTEIGYPSVVKVLLDGVIHKSDIGGVVTNIRDEADAKHAIEEISAALLPSQHQKEPEYVVEEMITDGVAELILGVKYDERFGFVLVFGSGGLLANLVSDVARVLLPTTRNEVSEALAELKVDALLQGIRGRPRGDIEATVSAIMKIAQRAEMSADTLLELDINPLIVRRHGNGTVGVDASILVRS